MATGDRRSGARWEVTVPGSPFCTHPSFREATLTVDPPIREVVCLICHRTIWQRQQRLEPRWPEGKP